jgi:hypothetical protein
MGLPLGTDPSLVLTESNFGKRLAALLAHHPVDRILVLVQPDSAITQPFVEASLTPLGFVSMSSTPRPIEHTDVNVMEFAVPTH